MPTQAPLAGTAASINPVAGIFDGFDIDWEFPAPAEKAGYTAFLTEFRRQLNAAGAATGKRYLLTAYLPAGQQNFQNIDLPAVGAVLDYANLQSYDFNGPYDQHTGFNAPLYQSEYDNSNFNINDTVTAYVGNGFPARKILLGIPFYAYGWTATGAEQPGQNGRFVASVNTNGTGSAPPTPNPMYVSVQQNNSLLPPPAAVYTTSPEDYTLFSDILPFSQVFRDPRADVPYLWDGTNFWSYDDQQSIRTKMNYALVKGLGG
ncbi:MAG TPA: glycoside hydrolase family 18 protein, partial [Bryobacteraceae bacterium]|nr:glycoside hydrolase family 18 protein [Bryobacteraceae bacterium]